MLLSQPKQLVLKPLGGAEPHVRERMQLREGEARVSHWNWRFEWDSRVSRKRRRHGEAWRYTTQVPIRGVLPCCRVQLANTPASSTWGPPWLGTLVPKLRKNVNTAHTVTYEFQNFKFWHLYWGHALPGQLTSGDCAGGVSRPSCSLTWAFQPASRPPPPSPPSVLFNRGRLLQTCPNSSLESASKDCVSQSCSWTCKWQGPCAHALYLQAFAPKGWDSTMAVSTPVSRSWF